MPPLGFRISFKADVLCLATLRSVDDFDLRVTAEPLSLKPPLPKKRGES